jgi:cellulose biosynthesis protein BcsQ
MTAVGVPGEVITFYSYKGGTGRTMALANTACLLAQRDAKGKVLMIDWDLEAPGLHLYFKDKCQRWFPGEDDSAAQALDAWPGLIDLFEKLDADIRNAGGGGGTGEDPAPGIVARLDISTYVVETDIPSLHLLKAGKFTEDYTRRVNRFRWDELFRLSPALIRSLAERLTAEYRYVLVDSRTGLTDTSGICTVLMPEKLVVVFTPNRQSLTGVVALVQRATRFRRESDDLRPLLVFPLPSRIEQARPTLRDGWRFGEKGSDGQQRLDGYQRQFERLLAEVYDLEFCTLGRYFDEVQIQQAPDYAYGEEIAALVEQSRDRLSLRLGYEIFARWLTTSAGPWDERKASVAADTVQEFAEAAQTAFEMCSSEEQEIAGRLFVQLVRLAASPEEGSDSPRKVLERNLGPAALPVPRIFVEMGVLVEADAGGGETTLELASESLLHDWDQLRRWIKEDRDFLLWRQGLREKCAEWERSGRLKDTLLLTRPLADAKVRLAQRADDLNQAERTFIAASLRRQLLWNLIWPGVAGLVVLLLLLLYHQSCTS